MDHAPAELFAKWRESFFSAYPTERSSSRCSAKIVFLIEICIENFVSIVFFVVKRSVRSSSSKMHKEAVFLGPVFILTRTISCSRRHMNLDAIIFKSKTQLMLKKPEQFDVICSRLSVTGGLIGKAFPG